MTYQICFPGALVLLALSAASEASEQPLNSEEIQHAEIEPLELDPIEVTGERSFEEEVTLRFLRQAIDGKRSERSEDIDNWVCWFEKATGTRFTYLNCARNGDLWALRPSDVPGTGLIGSNREARAGYGTILRSTRPANRIKVRKALKNLPGSNEFDREFLARAAMGERPPRDIPSGQELDQFTAAWQTVNNLTERGADDDTMEAAINEIGLTLERFNRIAALTKIYQSIENEVAVRLKQRSP